jgi:hypothetical protein
LTRSARSTRGVSAVSNGQDDVLLVQHLVVLQVVHQRGRHESGIAGQEHGGALDDVRGPLLQALDQIGSGTSMRRVLLSRIAAPRRQVQISRPSCRAEQQRHPSALEQFQEIGGEKA